MKKIQESIDFVELGKTRRHLHQHPDLSEDEKETTDFLVDYLNKHTRNAQIQRLACEGVLVCFDSQSEGSSTLIRVDIDALPIQEINEFEYKSVKPGISHKCGHDGHTTIGLGVAQYLDQNPIKKGKVYLIFQPAEEVGRGALKVLEQPEFKDLNFDFAYALHNLPGKEMGAICWKEGIFTSNVFSWVIQLKGKTAHAGEPESGLNPSIAAAKLLLKANELNHNDPNSEDFFIMVPVHVNIGSVAYGISAGYGELHFTVRSWHKRVLQTKSDEFMDHIRTICKEEHLEFDQHKLEAFESNLNDPDAVSILKNALKNSELKEIEAKEPNKWGEDFGYFTHRLKGCMFGLGSGLNTPALHNPDYDFPDEILEPGVEVFCQIVNQINEFTKTNE